MKNDDIVASVRTELLAQYETLEQKSDILKAPELKELFARIPTLEPRERAAFGQAINALSVELKAMVAAESGNEKELEPIDVTAPFDTNASRPDLLPSDQGTIHPLSQEIAQLSDIFNRMGFMIEESREIDDQYHMF